MMPGSNCSPCIQQCKQVATLEEEDARYRAHDSGPGGGSLGLVSGVLDVEPASFFL